MKRLTLSVALAAALAIGVPVVHADSFTYHGSLQDAGKAADGSYDMQLTLYSQREGGAVLAGPITLYAVPVKEGNFVTAVDFGAMAPLASQGWVGVKVKPAGETQFTALDVRSPVEPEGGSCPGSWTLDGNAGIPSGSYIGTADTNTVYIESNAHTAAYFNPNGAVGIAYPDGASGAYSTAIGYHAATLNDGSTMIGGYNDNGLASGIRDSAQNQFIVAAAGGVGINTSHAPDGNPLYDELTIAPSPSLPGTNADLTLETTANPAYSGFNIAAEPGGYLDINGMTYNGTTLTYDRLLTVNYLHGPGGYAEFAFNGTTYHGPLTVGNDGDSHGNGAYVTSGGVWTNASSRSFKEGFGSVDAIAVLDKLVALPVQTWFYKASRDEGQHMGPFAEDFAKTFGLGNDEKHITTVDESGVALAAIQGLNRKVENENAQLRQQNADLHSQLDRVMARLDKLEADGEK